MLPHGANVQLKFGSLELSLTWKSSEVNWSWKEKQKTDKQSLKYNGIPVGLKWFWWVLKVASVVVCLWYSVSCEIIKRNNRIDRNHDVTAVWNLSTQVMNSIVTSKGLRTYGDSGTNSLFTINQDGGGNKCLTINSFSNK